MRAIGYQILVGIVGGLAAGALVGSAEILLLAAFTGEWWGGLEAIGYAATVYGVLCAFLGALCGAGWGLWSAWRRRASLTWVSFAVVIAIVLLILATTNRVGQDLFQGGTTLDQTSYLLTLVLFVLALDLTILGTIALARRVLAERHTKTLTRPGAGLALGLGTLLAAIGLSYALIPLLDQNPTPVPATVPPDLRDRPNVVVILADALRADRLGCYGNGTGLTPHIDELARDGVVYRNTTAQAPWTKPSVATLLTSMYPSSHQAIHDASLLPDAVTTLPEALSAAGYRTVAYSTNPYVNPAFNFDQGFDEFTLEPGERFGGPPMASQLTVYGYAMRALKFATLDHFLPIPLWPRFFYQEIGILNEDVLGWLEANRHGRFFAYVHYMDPHDPYFDHPYNSYTIFAGQGYLDPGLTPEMNRLYDGEVAYLDAHVGHLIRALKEWGLYDEALIVLTSDHGEEFNEHGGFSHGETLYREQIAVPLVVKYPGSAHRGLVDDAPARLLDVAPTVLDTIGLSVPTTMQGLSLLPGAGVPRADYVFAETDRWGCVVWSIQDGRHKLVVANEGNPRALPPTALFDLQADPGERYDILADEPDIARRLRGQLDQAMAFARANAVAAQSGELDPATRERLRQLGY